MPRFASMSVRGAISSVHPFLFLVAKQHDRFGSRHLLCFTGEQIAHFGAGLQYAGQTGVVVCHCVELFRSHQFAARHIRNQTRIHVSCWLRLAVMLDAFSYKVVACAMGERATIVRCRPGLMVTIRLLNPEAGPVRHTDQGVERTGLPVTSYRSKPDADEAWLWPGQFW
jgi:hypothetical protein